MPDFTIGGRPIGRGHPCFLIAEAGSNHDRDLGRAHRLIELAAEAGVDAVKFQVFTAAGLAAPTRHEVARIDFAGAKSLYELYQGIELPPAWLPELKAHCDERGLLFLATPFDEGAADALDDLGVLAFKVASFELLHLPLLRHLARKGKPLILSTGRARLGEVEEALAAVRAAGGDQVALLHCTSSYPTPPESVNLAAIDTLQRAFQVPVGLSDHTLGIAVPIAAAARGAHLIEKHFTPDRSLPGPDHSFALEADELAAMVAGVRAAEAAIGSPRKEPTPEETDAIRRGRRSLFAAVDIAAGTVLEPHMLRILRPGVGLAPRELERVVGRRARRDIEAHEPITWDVV